MTIKTALIHVLEEYPLANSEKFSNHPLASFIRDQIPNEIINVLKDNDRYISQGSPGKGRWALIPWVAIFDRTITETAQEGYYLVYLFREDCSGIFLSLNQGVTTVMNSYGTETKRALEIRASDYLAKLGKVDNKCILGPIDLHTENMNSLGALYEKGAIVSKYYKWDNFPDENQINDDLQEFINYYYLLTIKDLIKISDSSLDMDEMDLEEEDFTKIREHKQFERNRHLAEKVKKIHGFVCEACNFDFEKGYGTIGKYYIEAHHLTPASKQKGMKVKLNPKTDFAVLCANCHRMIHRSEFIDDIETFRKLINK
jgi:5-methylcytosine-specific restriction enzyme A